MQVRIRLLPKNARSPAVSLIGCVYFFSVSVLIRERFESSVAENFDLIRLPQLDLVFDFG